MTRATFEEIPIIENHEPLVGLEEYPFLIEAAYFAKGLSKSPTLQLRIGVADKLLKIQQSFKGEYRFKIWDGYRPRKVQNAIYNSFYDSLSQKNPYWDEEKLHHETEQFVTKATTRKRIPPHATGGAVDLTLVNKKGEELDMGTGFDFFGPEAASLYFEIEGSNSPAQENRKILRNAMIEEGFTSDEDEWWHFDFGNQLWALRLGVERAVYGEVK